MLQKLERKKQTFGFLIYGKAADMFASRQSWLTCHLPSSALARSDNGRSLHSVSALSYHAVRCQAQGLHGLNGGKHSTTNIRTKRIDRKVRKAADHKDRLASDKDRAMDGKTKDSICKVSVEDSDTNAFR